MAVERFMTLCLESGNKDDSVAPFGGFARPGSQHEDLDKFGKWIAERTVKLRGGRRPARP
jgi:hypothetical protein